MLPGGVFSTKYGQEMAIVRTRTQWILLCVGIACLFVVPIFANSYWLSWLIRLAIVIVAVLGLHLLSGLCGQISIGHAAFMGVGAYTVAILTAKMGWNGWLCLPLCGLSAGLVGILFGLPCFRLKGFYLAITTLAASYIIVWCFQHFGSVTGGYIGLGLQPLQLGPIDFRDKANFYCLTVAIVIVVTLLAKNIQRTASGRAFVAIRDNELAAEVSGIAVFRYKMLAFFVGCVFAGVAGWLWAYSQLRVNPDQFRLYDSMWYIGILIIGGWGSTVGVFFGAIFLSLLQMMIDNVTPFLTEAFPGLATQIHVSMGLLVFGLVVVLFLMFEPKGLGYRWEKLKVFYRLHPLSSLGNGSSPTSGQGESDGYGSTVREG